MSRSWWGLRAFSTILLVAVGSTCSGEDVRVFALTTNRQYEDLINPVEHPRIADLAYRELVRQGLLLSAREEFGLATRDETLLETVDRESPETFDVVTTPKMYHGIDFEVSRAGVKLLGLNIRDMFDNINAYENVAQIVEKQSRNEYADMLEKAGYDRNPNQWLDSAELPEGAEAMLLEMNDISQFRALRAIHNAIRESGESPERLAGLVRGYSNLGQLTIRGIDCRGFAFRCRSLLYATRLREKTNNAPLAVWCLAYANVMMGLPTPAQKILHQFSGGETPQPEWVNLLDDYCHFRYEELAERAFGSDDPYGELAAVLWVRAIQQLNSPVALLEAGKQAMERVPYCLYVQEQMYQGAGVGYQRMLTGLGPQMLSTELRALVPQVEDVPTRIKRKLEELEDLNQVAIASLARAIVAAGKEDRQEPSLEVLGQNIQATNMMQIFRTAWVWKGPIGSDAAEYIDTIAPAAKDHPLFPLLQTFRYTYDHLKETYEPLVKDFEFKDGNPFTGYQFYNTLPEDLRLANVSVKEARELCWFCQMKEEEAMAADIFRSQELREDLIDRMQDVSEESPLRRSAELHFRFDRVSENLDDFLERYGEYPSVQLAAANGYFGKRDYEQASRFASAAAAKIPDYGVINLLAESYYKLGDEKWLPTLEMVLEREDYGLEHAKANCKIAATLMSEGKYEQALPYAEAAADSGSSWGFRTYLECLTANEQWDKAEEVARADSYRYRTNLWFAWCASTGHGDLDEAWKLEQQRMRQFDELGATNIDAEKMWYLIAKGDDQAALDHVSGVVEASYRPWYNIMQAQLADAVGNTELRDASLTKLAAWKPANDADWSVYNHMPPLLQQALKEDKLLVLDDILPIFEGRSDIDRWAGGAMYTIAEFNRLHGKGDEKLEAHKRLACIDQIDQWPRILAWVHLRKEGIEPSQLEGRRFEMQFNR